MNQLKDILKSIFGFFLGGFLLGGLFVSIISEIFSIDIFMEYCKVLINGFIGFFIYAFFLYIIICIIPKNEIGGMIFIIFLIHPFIFIVIAIVIPIAFIYKIL